MCSQQNKFDLKHQRWHDTINATDRLKFSKIPYHSVELGGGVE